MDRNGGGEGDAPRSLPTPFLTKTYQLVDDHTIDEIISWNEDGSAFIVWNPTELARDLLPKYFKHNNFSSFVRQLNTYGFRKVVPDRWEFSNDCFRRGEKQLLSDIQRRKAAGTTPSAVIPVQATPPVLPRTVSPSDSGEEQVFSSSNSPATNALEFTGTTVELIGENDRLRKENVQLNKELSQMKSLCNNIYDLMTNYASNKKSPSSSGIDDVHARICNPKSPENPLKLLDLLPMTKFCDEIRTMIAPSTSCDEEGIRSAAEEINTRLFGVPICLKRGRDGEGSSTEEMDLQLQQPEGNMKSEPMDEDNVGDDQRSPWLTRSSSSRNQRVCNGED